jgi:hypothetical protein
MNRRFFNQLLLGSPLAYFLPLKAAEKNILIEQGGWIVLSDKWPENAGYKIEFPPIFETPFREEPNFQWIITYPDGEKYDLSWAITFNDNEIQKEKAQLLDELFKEENGKTILHQLHCSNGKEHKLLIVYEIEPRVSATLLKRNPIRKITVDACAGIRYRQEN